MNRVRFIAAILAASMVILMSGVMQAQAEITYIPWGYTVSPKGIVWQISTVNPITGTPLFSGRSVDPDTILAEIHHRCLGNGVWHTHYVEPMKVVLTDKLIILVFDKSSLPRASLPDPAPYTKVTGEFINTAGNVDTFSAQGPGFVVCITGTCGPWP